MLYKLCFLCLFSVLASPFGQAQDFFAGSWGGSQPSVGGGAVLLEVKPPDAYPDKYADLVSCKTMGDSEPIPESLPFPDNDPFPVSYAPPVYESLTEPLPEPVPVVLPEPVGLRKIEDMFFSDEPVVLTPKEQYAVEIVEPWQNQTQVGVNPIAAPQGAIQFVYGLERPSVLCAVYQITDIELQSGEVIQSVNIGDSARWIIEPAMSGADIPHLLVKPVDVGLETSLAVATDRRMYHLKLRSHRNEYMARVNFTYPEDSRRLEMLERMKADAEAKREQERRERDTIPETKEYLGDLDFGYVVTGQARWKPTRVYNDGVKTIIEMPETLHQDDSPILLVLRKKRGLVRSSNEEVLVNYRVQRNRYIVDAVFEKAMLVVGVGRNQTRVVIERARDRKRGPE